MARDTNLHARFGELLEQRRRIGPGTAVLDLDVPDRAEPGDLADTKHRTSEQALVQLDDALHDIADDHGVDHETDQQVRALHRFIAQLDGLNRALLLLYLEDQSYRQIAGILGISETNVAAKLSRLKQRSATRSDPNRQSCKKWNSTNRKPSGKRSTAA